MKHLNCIKIFTLSLLAMSLFACKSSDVKKAQTPPAEFKMAAILPLTGDNASDAHAARRGIDLAVEEINAKAALNKNPKIKMIYADTKNSSQNMDSILEALEYAEVDAIHAGFTNDIVFGVENLGNFKGCLVNFLCDYPPAAVQVKNAVRIFPNGAQICELMAQAAAVKAEKFGDKKLLIASVNTPAGKSCGDYLKFQTGSSNYKIFYESFSEGESNFKLFVEQIMNIQPDYILVYSSKNSAAELLKELKKQGFKGVFATNQTSELAEIKSEGGTEVYEVSAGFDSNSTSKAQEFRAAFAKKFAAKPNYISAYAYDGVYAIYDALLKCEGDANFARDALLGKTLNGASGKIEIDKLGDTISDLRFLKK